MVQITRENAVQEIMEHYGAELLRTARGMVKDKMIAEDMVQETLIKVYEKFDTFCESACLRTWVYKIMLNQCKDYLRSYTKRKVTLWDDAYLAVWVKEKEHPLTFLETQERNHQLRKAVEGLNASYRDTVNLYYFQHYSIRQLAECLNANENTVKTRLKRARNQLNHHLKRSG
ncbi:sigma-70 family RNA polymerase sigma factor [Thalassobacillus sp. CUG 92003]|uniref:sigma-70 family RNA polymerase sigma factor n=1 Tax=Thalassobacillus sp. CUG 92003 TaxID=2736641 RepID=UPI0015E70F84|nr:sigma-70 family RNA polymerase sigma factor [Thalassobacillus sp. CUG 92003]